MKLRRPPSLALLPALAALLLAVGPPGAAADGCAYGPATADGCAAFEYVDAGYGCCRLAADGAACAPSDDCGCTSYAGADPAICYAVSPACRIVEGSCTENW